MVLTWQTLTLVVVALIGAATSIYYHRLAEAEAQKLSPEDRESFYTNYLNRDERTKMPARLNALAAASDRVRGARMGVTLIICIAVLLTIL